MKVHVSGRDNTEVQVLGDAVSLMLTGEEFHDLQVLMHIPQDHLRDGLALTGGAAGHGMQTFDVYGLIRNLREVK